MQKGKEGVKALLWQTTIYLQQFMILMTYNLTHHCMMQIRLLTVFLHCFYRLSSLRTRGRVFFNQGKLMAGNILSQKSISCFQIILEESSLRDSSYIKSYFLFLFRVYVGRNEIRSCLIYFLSSFQLSLVLLGSLLEKFLIQFFPHKLFQVLLVFIFLFGPGISLYKYVHCRDRSILFST